MQETFPAIVYLLCVATSAACAWFLMKTFAATGARLLLWSGLCFLCLAGNNALLILDLLVFPDMFDLRIPRHLLAFSAVAILLYGFVWDLEQE